MKTKLERAFSIVDDYALAQVRAAALPGMVIGITDRKRLLHVSTFGHSDISAGTPVSPDTLFEIGSISKSFASVIAMQLVDEGKLDVHRPVSKYLPWFKVRSSFKPITLHHLMSHTAGIVSGTEITLGGHPEVMALADTDATAAPGTYFHYSNVGYKIVGLVIEEILGKPISEALRERVLEPLGMRSSESDITSDLRGRLAVGYAPLHDDRPRPALGQYVPATWIESDTADGSISATASDMAAYMRMLLNRGKAPGGALVSAAGFELLTQKAIHSNDSVHSEYYGYGLDVREEEGHVMIGHTGGMVGFVSCMLVDMQTGFGVIVMVNCSSYDLKAEICKIILRILGSAVEGGTPQVPDVVDASIVANAAEYAGTYRSGSRTLHIVAKGDRLFIDGRPRIPLESRGVDEFFADSPDYRLFPLRFGRDDVSVVEVVHGPDWFTGDAYRGPRTVKHPRSWEAFTGHFRTHNSWVSNFRVVLRKGGLVMIDPSGREQPLAHVKANTFRVGADPRSPERMAFDMILEGKAMRANLSGCECFRFFTP